MKHCLDKATKDQGSDERQLSIPDVEKIITVCYFCKIPLPSTEQSQKRFHTCMESEVI